MIQGMDFDGGADTVPAQADMRAALGAYVARINAGDTTAILALFAPDAVIEDPVGSSPKSGAAIVAWFEQTVAFKSHLRPVAPIRGSHANAAALTFEVRFQPPGGPAMLIRSLDICTFDADCRITSLRAYWGANDVVVLDPCD